MNNFLKFYQKKYYVISIILIFSATILFFCSKNSFLYSFNDWVDANAFFTMGKGMFNGLVPYKDLFEQKGPLLYLIYGIGYLIENDGFIGVFILEIISMTFTGYYLYKISCLYLNEKYSILSSCLTITVICGSISFVQGGSAEEFSLPFMTYGIYSFLILNENRKKEKIILFINGILAGCLALIKFNLLAFYFIWMAIYFFRLILKKYYFDAFYACFIFLVGMSVPILISLVYFYLNGALYDYINVYVGFNLSAYTTKLPLIERCSNMFRAFYDQLNYDFEILLLTILSLVFIIIYKFKKNIWSIIFLILSFLFLIVGIYFGGLLYIYYYLCFMPYTIFGSIFIFKIIQFIQDKIKKINVAKIFFCMIFCLVLSFSIYNSYKSPNAYTRNLPKEYYAQYVFKDIIDKSDDRSLLNYDNLDGGFYTTCDIIPNVKYFMRQNVDYQRYPEILDSQNRYIEEKVTNFVVVREYFGNLGYHDTLTHLNQNYQLIAKHEQQFEHMDFVYFLYQRK